MPPTDTPALLAAALRAVLKDPDAAADQARRALAIYDAEQARLTSYRDLIDTTRDQHT